MNMDPLLGIASMGMGGLRDAGKFMGRNKYKLGAAGVLGVGGMGYSHFRSSGRNGLRGRSSGAGAYGPYGGGGM